MIWRPAENNFIFQDWFFLNLRCTSQLPLAYLIAFQMNLFVFQIAIDIDKEAKYQNSYVGGMVSAVH